MKLKLLSVFVLTALAVSQTANARQPEQAGISGDFGLSVFHSSDNGQFNTENEDTLSTLNRPNSDYQKTNLIPLGNIAYTFADKRNQLFLGASRADVAIGRLHFDFGYRHWLNNGTELSFSLIPGLLDNETWSDPYITEQKRETTDSQSSAVRFEVNQISGSGLSAEVALGKIDVDEEHSGQTQYSNADINLLNRNADVLFTELSYTVPIDRGVLLRGATNYLNYDADGAAMAYDKLTAEATLIVSTRAQSIVTTLSYSGFNFDRTHPIFNEKRDENEWSLFVAYEYRNFLGWNNWSLVSLLGYKDKRSNIAFFEEESWLTSIGLNYRF